MPGRSRPTGPFVRHDSPRTATDTSCPVTRTRLLNSSTTTSSGFGGAWASHGPVWATTRASPHCGRHSVMTGRSRYSGSTAQTENRTDSWASQPTERSPHVHELARTSQPDDRRLTPFARSITVAGAVGVSRREMVTDEMTVGDFAA